MTAEGRAVLRLVTALLLIGLVGAGCRPRVSGTISQSPPPSPAPEAEVEEGPETTVNGQPFDPGTAADDKGQAQEPPTSGGLETLIQNEVGPFSLAEAARDAQTITQLGASDAISTAYRNAQGVSVLHLAAIFDSPQTALAAQELVGESLVDNIGAAFLGEEPFTNNEGAVIGRIFAFETTEAEILMWTNGPLLATAESGTEGAVVAFFEAAIY
ncbi:MAG: hypothetical protein ACRDI1_00505 [Actinomycetota bacterium]